MKRFCIFMLCALLMCNAGTLVSATEQRPSLIEVMDNQVSDDVRNLLTSSKNYTEDSKLLLHYDKVDLANARILTHHTTVDQMLASQFPSEMSEKRGGPDYYLIVPNTDTIYRARILADQQVSLSRVEDLTWSNFPISLLAIMRGSSNLITLCGSAREVTGLYSFSHSYVSTDSCLIPHPLVFGYAIVFAETTSGTFVRITMDSTGEYLVDMPLETYHQWVTAYEDYQEFFSAPEYYKYTDRNLDQFDELIYTYGSVDAYYQYVNPIRERQQKQNYETMVKMLPFIIGIPAAIGFIIWRRAVNRKKYKM